MFDQRVRALFAEVSPQRSEVLGLDPLGILNTCSGTRLGELAADPVFVARADALLATLTAELDEPTWAHSAADALGAPLPQVAYFSPEFGLAASVPQYSGGLGVLAGDHLKAAADLGVPIIGVGLFYRSGYFRQVIDPTGRQQERFPWQHPSEVALSPVDGVSVSVPLGDTEVTASVWKAVVGPNELYLLDTHIPGEQGPDQLVNDRLYGGGSEERIRQELLLGVGGHRMLRALGFDPQVFHLNEGHAGFLTLERIRVAMQESSMTFAEAVESVRPSMLFTTHTPVPAGIDRFAHELVRRYFAWWSEATGVPIETLLDLGSEPGGDPEVFNLAHMSLRLCGDANGVSLLHGDVSRRMFSPLWPGIEIDDVPIGAVTNGVHAPTFMADDIADIVARTVGDDWQTCDHERFSALSRVAPAELWAARSAGRSRLVDFVRERARRSVGRQLALNAAEAHGVASSNGDGAWIDTLLDPDTLTIGFARRFATYKRATMLLSEPDRLRHLLTDPQRPLQLVFAGKAHPADEPGKDFLQAVARIAEDPVLRSKVVFLEDYDLDAGRMMTRGVDVWLNTPLRPMEACGTSGMKAALNGVLNLSVRDGWWDEAYTPEVGWAIPTTDHAHLDPVERDRIESTWLYEIIERQVVPLFYDRDPAGVPLGWTSMMASCIAALAPQFQAGRMVRDYTLRHYVPAAERSTRLTADDASGARALAAWKTRVAAAWHEVHLAPAEPPVAAHVDEEIEVHASLYLGSLSPDDVEVSVLVGDVAPDGDIASDEWLTLTDRGIDPDDGARRRYSAHVVLDSPGSMGFAVRVVPRHPLLDRWSELALIRTAS
ncbi:MAG: alpha-glucan family phosphorylase [Microthrixaceae bacterium]|nr:alpha-glucan family phosphorylase [Microthrixaceae bacterium]